MAKKRTGEKPPKEIKLTNKQRIFIREYLKDLNATQAALRAGYSIETAYHTGYENLKKPHIVEIIEWHLQKREEDIELDAKDLLRELLMLATYDPADAYDEEGRLLHPKDMPLATRKAIASFDIQEMFEYNYDEKEKEHVGDMKKLKFLSKEKSIDLLGKYLNLFTDRVKHEHDFKLEDLLDLSNNLDKNKKGNE